MLAFWFVLGAVCGVFVSMIVKALFFMAKESGEKAPVPTECLNEKLVLRDTVHPT
jgi:hypothetical protein